MCGQENILAKRTRQLTDIFQGPLLEIVYLLEQDKIVKDLNILNAIIMGINNNMVQKFISEPEDKAVSILIKLYSSLADNYGKDLF